MQDAFVNADPVPGKVFIMDDILRIGSIISTCTLVLKDSGPDFVAVLTAGTPYLHRLILDKQ